MNLNPYCPELSSIYPPFDQPTLAHQGTQCYFPTFVGLSGGNSMIIGGLYISRDIPHIITFFQSVKVGR